MAPRSFVAARSVRMALLAYSARSRVAAVLFALCAVLGVDGGAGGGHASGRQRKDRLQGLSRRRPVDERHLHDAERRNPPAPDHLPRRGYAGRPTRLVTGWIADRLPTLRTRHRLRHLHGATRRHPPAPAERAVRLEPARPVRRRVHGRLPPRRPSDRVHPRHRLGTRVPRHSVHRALRHRHPRSLRTPRTGRAAWTPVRRRQRADGRLSRRAAHRLRNGTTRRSPILPAGSRSS